MTESCLICLEETDHENNVIYFNLSTEKDDPCNCKFYCHLKCWMDYYIRKGYFECPICHSKFKTNIIQEQTIIINNPSSIQSVSIPINIEEQVQIILPTSVRPTQIRTNRNRSMFCLLILLLLFLISFPFMIGFKR